MFFTIYIQLNKRNLKQGYHHIMSVLGTAKGAEHDEMN